LQSCIGGNVLLKRISWATPQTTSLAQFRRPELDQTSPKDVWGGLTLQEHLGSSVTAARTAMLDVLQALRTSMASRCRHTRRSQTTSCDVDTSHELNGNIVSTSLLPAKVLILFSGGVDSTLLAMLAHEVVPRDEPIDLVNICFGGGISADREASLDALKELRFVAPTRNWRLIGIDKSMDDVDAARPHLMQLLAPANTVMDLNIGAALWMATQADGMLLEPLRHNGLREGQHAAKSAPRGTHGSSADQPQAEELNGEDAGQKHQGTYYRSEARVVLLGHGADELFAGYGRHRTRYRAAGLHGLAEELTLDFNRLWIRNLGRDDRLVADRGREARHPYLDEGVIAAALRHPLSALIDFGLPPGEGDKKVLRECLRELGLPRAASRVKRAIQFGSRLARAANVQQFGGTRQANKNRAGSVKLAVVLQNALKLSQ
jgi:asparagine synthetase B (glutamine-hydrolysing)